MARFQFYIFLITFIAINFSFSFSKDNSPDLLDYKNGYGYLYYFTFHPGLETDSSLVEIYITCPVRTNAYLEIEDLNLIKKIEIGSNEIGKFELTAKEALVYSKGVGEPPKPEQIWTGRAIRIYTDFPVLMYGVYKSTPNSAEGFLILPVTSLGKEYQISSYNDPSNNTSKFLPSFTSIVGIYDNTQVSFRLGGCESCKVPKEDGDTLEFGEVISRKLNEGDVWLIPGIGSFTDLTSSKVTSSKPVAVFSGNYSANVPSHLSNSNYLIEQENPTNIWETKYYIAPVPERKKASIIKIFARYPNTDVTLDGVPMWNIKNSGGAFGDGFIETRAFTKDTIKPVIIQSINDSLPINVVQYNTSGDDDGVSSAPYQLNVLSKEQFNKQVTFFIPQITDDQEANINIIYKATNDSKIPDNFKIRKDYNENNDWVELNTISSDPGKPFIADIPDSDGRIYYVKTMKLNSNKIYSFKAKDDFMVYVYGNSYALPISFAYFVDDAPDTLAPTVTFTIGTNSVEGTVTDEPQDDPDEIRSDLGLVYMDDKSQNFEFEVDKFEMGVSPSTNWRLKVIDTTYNSIAYLIFIDRAGNRTDTTISIKARPNNLRIHDSLALVALYNSTNGVLWNNNSNWLTDKPIEEWFGVVVDSGRVTSLKLSSNNLLGSIPDNIKYLSDLRVLLLSSNLLVEKIPTVIGQLTKLEDLNLSDNQLVGQIPNQIKELKNLRILNLSRNFLYGALPSALFQLDSLRELKLSHNNLGGGIPNVSKLKYLQELLLNNNEFENLNSGFDSLKYLVHLDLSYNKIWDYIPEELSKCTNLNFLAINNNNFTGIIPEGFKKLELTYLWLHNNQLRGGLENLPNNIQRENFSIYSNRFDFADLPRSSIAINEDYSPQDSIGNPGGLTKKIGESFELRAGDEYYNGNIYQWFKDGLLMNNQTAQKFEISSLSLSDAGFYYCEIINPQFSELKLTSRKFKLKVIDPTSINDEIDIENVKLYPNPAEDFIYLNYVNSIKNISDLYILDYLGNQILVKSDLINDNSIRINISNLSKGIYFIKQGNYIYKFMKY